FTRRETAPALAVLSRISPGHSRISGESAAERSRLTSWVPSQETRIQVVSEVEMDKTRDRPAALSADLPAGFSGGSAVEAGFPVPAGGAPPPGSTPGFSASPGAGTGGAKATGRREGAMATEAS